MNTNAATLHKLIQEAELEYDVALLMAGCDNLTPAEYKVRKARLMEADANLAALRELEAE